MSSIFDYGLQKCAANYECLTPLSFLRRTADVYPGMTAIIYRNRQITYRQLLERSMAFAGFLDGLGLVRGDTVSVMLPNIPQMVELQFGAISGGRVLHAVNTRLDADAIRFQMEHAETKVLVFDSEYARVVATALAKMKNPPRLVEVHDVHASFPPSEINSAFSYERALESGASRSSLISPSDEWDAIAISYTSGTTGNPKGVVTHHRGAYLNAMANVIAWSMRAHPVYLWVLPLFHCNGWCFPWTVTLLGGTHVCLRKVDAEEIIRLTNVHGVSNFCAAPVVLSSLAECAREGLGFNGPVNILTAGAAPAPRVIEDVERLGAVVTQVYGLTETYASTVVSAWQAPWNVYPPDERFRLKSRAGIQYPACEALDVFGPNGEPVPRDGETIGEVVVRGNTVMRGYLKNPDATNEAFQGGWFHTGDLGVRDPDGYISIRDRSKDMINSGGEKMSSLEVEEVLLAHPAVFEAAVVAAPDPKWGEVPFAFVRLVDGAELSVDELVQHCSERMARYKIPKRVVFGPIERTATGKVQKFRLRELAKEWLATNAAA
ncbi:AMP-binding protein [Paraburkholderia sp. C35]|uniref:AMP-binding protein n=1 Tax=Paraburkholderia sp. C35 TaxID=2126993 RepID=UPI000D6A00D1|nr:AMP-binding protein [Paraburkholderia sp. C35]